ncbi:DUF3379 family protein [Planctobacterium marinum]|uniref:DUF3379 family protein n=1 Tax=Planctobacterium marinum TaxID=1631968 RepID=UPI001E5E4A75|nr:DUF3379 family protein [Planctobacterium marinum]MCC2604530.1 DUF3379 domain-containing protein [Planctobacterium marinum]
MSLNTDNDKIRQSIMADPATSDAEITAAINADENLKEFQIAMLELDKAIKETSEVAVPEGLMDKLLHIPQSDAAETPTAEEQPETKQNKVVALSSKRNHIVQLALAASIAFAVGLSFTLFNQNPDIRSGADLALAHMYHERAYTQRVSREVSLEEVNTKLATFGGEMLNAIGQVTYANFCFFESQKSLHLVMHTESGDITLFVTPKDLKNEIDSQFQDDAYEGRSWKMQEADITIIGEKGKLDPELETRIRQSMQFSA